MREYIGRLRLAFGSLLERPAAGAGVLILFTVTMFTSATLLFLVQPMFARMILPLLGGSPAVWNTAVVFYQVMLLVGYIYAHLTRVWLGARRQALLHIALVLLPLPLLPIAVPQGWSPPTAENPIPWLLALLAVAVGLPFFVVSTSSPLLQSWFARSGHRSAHDPYFLYAASNLGSMLALLAYPFGMEPVLRLEDQSRFWAVGYGLLAALVICCALATYWRASPDAAATPQQRHTAPSWGRRLRWVLWAAVPSSLLLSVTTYLSTNISPLPLLWVIPLALYLLTFILVFATRPPIPHQFLLRLLPPLLVLLVVSIVAEVGDSIYLLFSLHLIVFFVVTLVCHGELARTRPDAQHLTEFYLWMSFGGALGGMFTALLAPVLFDTVLEYPLVLGLLGFLLVRSKPDDSRRAFLLDVALPLAAVFGTILLAVPINAAGVSPTLLSWFLFGLPALGCLLFARRPLRFTLGVASLILLGIWASQAGSPYLLTERSFFGINSVRVQEATNTRVLVHGNVVHGMQSLDPARQREPLSYYYSTGPLGQLFAAYDRPGAPPLREVGVIGLGVGSTACYARPGQSWTFYEIDPVVERLARDDQLFTFLRDCTPDAPVVLGDARLSLSKASSQYDLMVLDAYSSDAVPVHLVTREALALYESRLAPGGILAFHITNRYLDLAPVLAGLSADAGMVGLQQRDDLSTPAEQAAGKTHSQWVLIARDAADLALVAGDERWRPLEKTPDPLVWTDDFSSIWAIVRWH